MAAADLVFAGGSLFAPEAADRLPSGDGWVAVRAGRIAAVGGSEVRELVGPSTRVVDISGCLLVPGFQDAHIHPVQGGRERLTCDLSGLGSEAGYVEAVRRYAAAEPDLPWITGGGWMLAAFPGGLPRREALDDAVPDRPVLLLNRDHHGAWVNTAGLRAAGVTAETPDPPDGRIERDLDGSPTGMLHEGAMELVSALVPEPTPQEQRAALLEAQRYLHSLGITGWQDALLGSYANITDASAVYAGCADDGELSAKVIGALWWDRSRGAEQIEELVARRRAFSRARFRPTSVKIMQDGIVENGTAAMLAPYLDRAGSTTANAGLSMVDPEALGGYVTELDDIGFQVHVHAIGDRAVREALDAFAVARTANGPSEGRHHIAHIQVIHPDDVDRFGRLGVTANMQPLWAAHEEQMDELTIPYLGPERAGWQYPFRALEAAGSRLAAGSDWPVSSPDPLWGMHVAVNRVLPDGARNGVAPLDPFLPQQRLSVESALRAYTAGSAYLNHLDDTGTIRVGARADLAVVDRDILRCPREGIASASVLATYVDGIAVFEA